MPLDNSQDLIGTPASCKKNSSSYTCTGK